MAKKSDFEKVFGSISKYEIGVKEPKKKKIKEEETEIEHGSIDFKETKEEKVKEEETEKCRYRRCYSFCNEKIK